MKRFLFPIICIFTLLAACTSDEGVLKEEALKVGQGKFNEMIQKESGEILKESPRLQQAYVGFIRGTSEIEVEEIKFEGETRAVVSVIMKIYPNKLRLTLLEVAQKVESSKSRKFNYGEALKLIAQQMGLKEGLERQPLTVLRFHKVSKKWVIE